MEKLKLIECNGKKYDFIVELPKRCRYPEIPIKVRIEKKFGEFRYIPRTHTFCSGASLTIDELQAIVNKLKELNSP